jgi:hypothetical protein
VTAKPGQLVLAFEWGNFEKVVYPWLFLTGTFSFADASSVDEVLRRFFVVAVARA